MKKDKEEKKYIVYIYNDWHGSWRKEEMAKKELEQYIDENGTKGIDIYKKDNEVKFKKVYELED